MKTSSAAGRGRVRDALKARLESDLALGAYVQYDTSGAAFSRSDSGGGGHSRSGHNFSRAGNYDALAAPAGTLEAAKRAFAHHLLAQ